MFHPLFPTSQAQWSEAYGTKLSLKAARIVATTGVKVAGATFGGVIRIASNFCGVLFRTRRIHF